MDPTRVRDLGARAHRAGVALGLLGGLAAPAEAHLIDTGMGPFYDGIGHFLVTPEQLLPVLALATLAGLRGSAAARAALLGVLVAWALGGVVAVSAAFPATAAGLDRFAWVPLLLFGALAATDAALGVRTVTALAVALGGLLGVQSGRALAEVGLGIGALAGTLVTAAVLATLATAGVAAGDAHLLTRRIARVAGSWLAACGLLQLGWSLR